MTAEHAFRGEQSVWSLVDEVATERVLGAALRGELRGWAAERMRAVPGSVWIDGDDGIRMRDTFVTAVDNAGRTLASGGNLD